MPRVLPLLALALTSLLSPAAFACAVCADDSVRNNQAYLKSTLFLSAMPLLFLAGAGWWIYQRVRAAQPRVPATP